MGKNQINVAELLKDCPCGMELDCLLWDNVTFERVTDDGIWIKHIDSKGGEHSLYVYNDGSFPIHNLGSLRTKCVIFPKGKTTWEGFQNLKPFKLKDGKLVPNKFDIKNLKPFDKVLVRSDNRHRWSTQFFERINNKGNYILLYSNTLFL